MNKPDRTPRRSLLQRLTAWFNDLRQMLVAAGRAVKAAAAAVKVVGNSVQQIVLVSIAVSAVLHDNETAGGLLRKAVELLAGA